MIMIQTQKMDITKIQSSYGVVRTIVSPNELSQLIVPYIEKVLLQINTIFLRIIL